MRPGLLAMGVQGTEPSAPNVRCRIRDHIRDQVF